MSEDRQSPIGLVVGAGGLLGSSVASELQRRGRRASVAPRFEWGDPRRFREEFASAWRSTTQEAADAGRPWAIHWCAGLGHIGATEPALAADDELLSEALDVINTDSAPTEGAFTFASSAGAIYAASVGTVSDENTTPAPLSAYGRAKLRQEAMISQGLAETSIRVRHLRISNLYGPGQKMTKPQGLLSHLVVNTLSRRPSTIYVPLDTSRDYLHTASAGRMVVASADRSFEWGEPKQAVRVLAAERSKSIAQIIGALGRILRRRVPFVVARRPESNLQPLVLRFRSVDRSMHCLDTVTLEEGLASVVTAARSQAAVA